MYRVLTNLFYAFCSRGINFIVPLAIMPYLIDVYGINSFGELFFAQAIIQPFALISDFGFNVTAVKMIARAKKNIKDRNQFVSVVFRAKLYLTLISVLSFILLAYSQQLDLSLNKLFFFVLLSSILQVNQLFWFFQGMEQNAVFTIINLVAKLFFFLSVFLFAKKTSGIHMIPLLETISYVFSFIISLFIMIYKNKFVFVKTKFSEYADFIKESLNIAVISFFNWGAVSGTAVILRSSVLPADYGFFSAFARIFYYVFALFQPVNQTFQPVFARRFSEKSPDTIVYFRKAVVVLIVLLIVSAASFTFFLPQINQLFLSDYSYLLSANKSYLYYIYVMLIWVSLVILNSFITLQYFVSNGLTHVYRNLYIVNTLLSIFSAITLIKFGFGLIGFGLGLVIGELLYAITLFKFCKGFFRL